MRAYHFTSAVHALDDVRRRRIKIATLRDINDPFELAVCCDDRQRRLALQRTRAKWADRYGMICFSRGWQNPVQWSHYADRHHGICLGFNMANDRLTPVSYVDEPPQLDWDAIEQGGLAGEAEMLRWSTTKYTHWAYEAELRAFVALKKPDSNGRYFARFNEHLRLRQIIVGSESDVSRRDVAEACRGLDGLDIFKVRLAFGNYRVVKQKDESRWL